MKRILVVANRTLVEPHLLAELHRRKDEGEVAFHILVPASHPSGFWTDETARTEAQERLDTILEALRSSEIEADGEIGDANPVYGVGDVLRREGFDEIIVSTLPVGVSHWLANNVVKRMRHYGIPVAHVVAEPALARQ
jgi:GABA permease